MNTFKKISIICLSSIFVSCGNESEVSQENEIKKDSTVAVTNSHNCAFYYKEAKTVDSILLRTNTLNKDLAERAINTFNNYASECKLDSTAPVFLLKAGQIAQSIGKITQSQILLKKCVDEFPQFKNRGAALFLLAQLYDEPTMLNNEEEAKNIYEQIIKEYPNTAWARDAKSSINNLGKSDEELIESFMKMKGN